MGRFDTFRFRYRMPDGVTGTGFQTDDLDCECEFYGISAEGRLLHWPENADELAETGFDGCIIVCARQCYHVYLPTDSWNGSRCARRTISGIPLNPRMLSRSWAEDIYHKRTI